MRLSKQCRGSGLPLTAALLAALAAPVPGMTQDGTRTDGSQSLYVRNSGSVPLSTIHVSPDYRSNWGSDRLGSQPLQPGDQVQVDLGNVGSDCFFDVMVGNANGERHQFWSLNLCSQRTLDIR